MCLLKSRKNTFPAGKREHKFVRCANLSAFILIEKYLISNEGSTLMKLDEVNKKYAGEWIVARVSKMNKGIPEELEVLFHDKNHDEASKIQIGLKGLIAFFYAGEIADEGYAVCFSIR